MAKRTRQVNLGQILKWFEEQHEPPYEMSQVVDWAVMSGRWDRPDPEELVAQEMNRRARELAEVARKEHHFDPDGHKVRSYHCTTVQRQDETGKLVQVSLWSSREMASWEFKAKSIRQRHKQIKSDAVHLNVDVESMNKHDRPKKAPEIQLNWDFSDEVKAGPDADMESAG